MSAVALLTTRSSDYDVPASTKLGGTTIYAPDDEQLARGLSTLADLIERHTRAHLTLTRTTLNSLVRDDTGVETDRRIFGAVLGWRLRLGVLDSIPCAATSGKLYRVFTHVEQYPLFLSHLETLKSRLHTRRVLKVRDAEHAVFGQRRWGTWSSSLHLLARLVCTGHACYLDSKTFAYPL